MNTARLDGTRRCFFSLGLALGLAACTTTPGDADALRILTLLPADVILFGEQHDSLDHHRIERGAVAALAARGVLATVAIEMADQGRSTRHLAPDETEATVRQALDWNEADWPWRDYGPTVMTAVRAGVPVIGANLPRRRTKAAMADAALDHLLGPPALAAQQQAVRNGHCDILPDRQIAPMTRVQIARDRAMAETIEQALAPGRTVLLIAGAGHVRRDLGVPLHLERSINARAVIALAQRSSHAPDSEAIDSALPASVADLWITTPALPPKDHCAGLRSTSSPN